MRLVTVDMETHYSSTYSLSKMSPLEYVMDDQFQTICCAIKVDHHPTDVFFGETAVREAFASMSGIMDDALLLGHNMLGFDSYVLTYRYGIRPKMWGCTMAMARPIHTKTTGLSLAKLVAHYAPQLKAMGISGVKNNTALVQTRGKRLEDFTGAELEAMRFYNRDDTDQCYGLFQLLKKHYRPAELWQIDALTRMRTEPQFKLDTPLLEIAASVERTRKHAALLDVARQLKLEDVQWGDDAAVAEQIRSELASAPKFAALLEGLGADVPMKESPTTEGKMIPALSKTDEGFLALQEHDNPMVVAAAMARLDVKSTLLETRIQKFLTAGNLAGGRLPIPIRYCGADTTGRDSGEEYNPQNLPRINPKSQKPTDALRRSLTAGKGKLVIVADQSGIELRVNHFLWQVPSSMALYQGDPQADLYKAFSANNVYHVPVDEVTKDQRHIGKLCLLEGTLVLTERGEVPIEQVTAADRVWDGIEWSNTLGAIYKGEHDVIEYDGLTGTPDHEVWVEDGRKVRLGFASAQSLRLARSGEGGTPLGFSGAGSAPNHTGERAQVRRGPLHDMWYDEADELRQLAGWEDAGLSVVQPKMRCPQVVDSTHGSGAAALHEPERPSVFQIWSARYQVLLSERGEGRGMGGQESRPEKEHATGPGGQRWELRAGEPTVGHTQYERQQPVAVEGAPVSFVPAGAPGSEVRGQHPAHHAEQRHDGGADRLPVEVAFTQTKRRVWDLLECGPRHRFTANGRLVSNCHLGLGFGSGHATFQRIAKVMGGIDIPLGGVDPDTGEILGSPDGGQTCKDLVDTWREAYSEIVMGWKACGSAIKNISRSEDIAVDPWELVHTSKDGFVLPSGRVIRYPDLREMEDGAWPDGRPRRSWFYAHGRHKARITGPKADENIVQALARDSIFDCAVEYFKRTSLRPALRVHDELVYVVEETHAQDLLDELQGVLRTPPKWWPELVVWSEGDAAHNYGAAK